MQNVLKVISNGFEKAGFFTDLFLPINIHIHLGQSTIEFASFKVYLDCLSYFYDLSLG